MRSFVAVFLGAEREMRDYEPFLKLILVWVLIALGFLILWYFGFVQALIETDTTRISLVILAIFLVTSLHCLIQTLAVSQELIVARRVREAVVSAGARALMVNDDLIVTGQGRTLDAGVVTSHISNLMAKARSLKGGHFDQTLLLRSLADRLRAREKLGWFVSEALLRLALLGTAVGFILMLIPIAGLDAFDVELLRQTLAGMTSGMAIALNVTVAGIATALILKFQYYLLDGAIADLFREVTEITEVYVIPTLEAKAHAGPI